MKVRIIGKVNNGTKLIDVDFGVFESEISESIAQDADYITRSIGQHGSWDADHIRFYTSHSIIYLYHVEAEIIPQLTERCRKCPTTYHPEHTLCRACPFRPQEDTNANRK